MPAEQTVLAGPRTTTTKGAAGEGDSREAPAKANEGAGSTGPSRAIVSVPSVAVEDPTHNIDEERPPFSPRVARLPVELDVMVPVRGFRVRNLLSLTSGQIVESQWGHGDDVPLSAGDVALAWTEFEVMDTDLAVRITRLA